MKRWVGLVVGVLLLIGCGTRPAQETAPTQEVPVVPQRTEGKVVAEASIEPARWVELRFDIGGKVAEALVSPGDQVAAGAPLVRLDTAASELAMQNAEQSVLVQKAVLDAQKAALEEEVAAFDQQEAQAEIDLKVQQLQLDKARAQDPDADVAAAQANLDAAQAKVAGAVAQRNLVKSGPTAAEIAAAEAKLAQAELELRQASEAVDRIERAVGRDEIPGELLQQQSVAQASVQAAQAELNLLLAGTSQAQIDAENANVLTMMAQRDAAQAQLDQALADREIYTITLDIMAAEVEAAQLQLDSLRLPERDFAEAEARLRQAELSVDELELNVQKAELQAPFAGTVVEVRVEVGEDVNAGQIVVVLATLDQLQARTVDLTELDVVGLAEGQPAVVTVDALPDKEFSGTVRRVALQPSEYRGDVTYAVTIALDETPDSLLRWGMTAAVTINVED